MSKWKDRDAAWAKHLEDLEAKWLGVPVPISALKGHRGLSRCACNNETPASVIHTHSTRWEAEISGCNQWHVRCAVCDMVVLIWSSRLWAYELELHFNPRKKYREY